MYSIGISQHVGRCKTRLLSFPHKRGVRYNNVPADVYTHYAEPLASFCYVTQKELWVKALVVTAQYPQTIPIWSRFFL